MFQAYAKASALDCVALKAAMVMPSLLFQQPHLKSKVKDHMIHLEQRLQQRSDGNVEGLMEEGRTMQHQVTRQHQYQLSQQTTRTFAKLMMEHEVRAAL